MTTDPATGTFKVNMKSAPKISAVRQGVPMFSVILTDKNTPK